MNANARSLVVLAAAQIDGDGLQWIDVLPTAEKVRNGPWYMTITRADLETYAASLAANADLVPVDYDHGGAPDGDGSSVAAGWFTGETQVVEAGTLNPAGETQDRISLWARVKWTPQAVQEIQDGRFKRISAEMSFANRDSKNGLLTKAKEIIAATLTNRPFFAELAPVAAELSDDDQTLLGRVTDEAARAIFASALASDGTREQTLTYLNTLGDPAPTERDDMDPKILAALGLPEDADAATVLAAVTETTGKAEEAARLDEERKRLAKRTTTKGATMPNDELIAALGLADDADEAEVLAAVRRAKAGADRLDQLETENESLRATAASGRKLEERLKVIEADRRAERVERLISDGIRSGRVVPAEKAALAKQFGSNPNGLAELIDARPEHMFSLTARGHGDDLDEGDDVVSVKAQFASAEADGVDTESARLHVRATQILREQGKRNPTEAEYAEALAAASETVYR